MKFKYKYPQIAFEKFTLKRNYFRIWSPIHGIKHVYRVMYHSLNLCREYNDIYMTKLVFCSAYIHDMQRQHDGYCTEHGKLAAENSLPLFKDLFLSVGVKKEHLDVIAYAVTQHSLPDSKFKTGIYGDAAKLLKDADGLDRVRLGDLDASYLRFDFSRDYMDFAENLYWEIERSNIENFVEVIKIAEKTL